jgi:hypothetical protein
LFIPSYFISNIEKVNETENYSMVFNEFGKSKMYLYLIQLSLIIESIIPIIALITLSILMVFKLKKIIKDKLQLINSIYNNNKIKKSEIKFTKMIIILTVVFIITHTFNMFGTMLIGFIKFWNFKFNLNVDSLINLFQQFNKIESKIENVYRLGY